jgi:hypothetical protein
MCIMQDPTLSHIIQIPIADGENPSVLSGYACTKVYVHVGSDDLDLIVFLCSFSYAHTNFHKCIIVLGKIA